MFSPCLRLVVRIHIHADSEAMNQVCVRCGPFSFFFLIKIHLQGTHEGASYLQILETCRFSLQPISCLLSFFSVFAFQRPALNSPSSFISLLPRPCEDSCALDSG